MTQEVEKETKADCRFTLYVRFSRRIPNSVNIVDSVRELYPAVKNVRKPRQKQARWILVDFETETQAEEFKTILTEKKDIANIKVKVNKFNIQAHNGLVRPENEREQTKNALKREAYKAVNVQDFSNKLMASQLPENITKAEIAELFPGHLEIVLIHKPKPRAFITYSSVKEAFEARKQVRPVIDGKKFRVIILLLNYEKKERKNIKKEPQTIEEKPVTAVKRENQEKSVEKGGKKSKPGTKAKKITNQFVRPLRYFENKEIE